MCMKKLKTFFQSLVLLSLFFCSVPCSYSYADVTLTDTEAQELMFQITESQKDLTELQTQLTDVKNDYEEQKKSYEKQLKEVQTKNKGLSTALTVTSTSTVIFGALMLLFIFI